ncbi:MAG: hypothetical protein ACOZB3_09195 [Calditrichota bacterium]
MSDFIQLASIAGLLTDFEWASRAINRTVKSEFPPPLNSDCASILTRLHGINSPIGGYLPPDVDTSTKKCLDTSITQILVKDVISLHKLLFIKLILCDDN